MASRTSRFPTRILLSAAALGAAGGVYVVALNWASVLTGAIAYYIYAATIALWALPVLSRRLSSVGPESPCSPP